MGDQKFHVTCGSCGQSMAFREDQAGGRFRCPKCKEPVDLVIDEEEEAPRPAAPRRAAPAAPGKAKAAGGSSGAMRAAGAPARPGRGAPPPPPPRSSSGMRGRAAVPTNVQDEGDEVSPPVAAPSAAAAKKKKMMMIAGGGAAALLLVIVGAVIAFSGKSKPENAGKLSEGKDVWKPLAADYKSAENKEDESTRANAFEKLLAAVEASRKEHDYGWPDFFRGRVLRRMGREEEALASYAKALEKLDKAGQAYVKVERGLILARRGSERLLGTRRFRAGAVSLAPDAGAAELDKLALADLKAGSGSKEQEFFSGGLLALAQAEVSRIESLPSAALDKLGSAVSAKVELGYVNALMASLYFETGKYADGMKASEAALTGDSNSGFARLTRAWGLRRQALTDAANAEAGNWIDQAIELAEKAKSAGYAPAWSAIAALKLDKALLAAASGADIKSLLDDADSKAAEALAKTPDDVAAREIAAVIAVKRAEADEHAGKDARSGLDRAISTLDAIAGDGSDIPAVMNRARALMQRARAEGAHGGDPRLWYDRAAKDFTSVRGKDGIPGNLEPILGGATANVEKAIEDSKRGTDATAIFEKAINDMSSIINSRSDDPSAKEARGLAYWAMGDALNKAGKDGTVQINKALDDLYEIFQAKPTLRIGLIMFDARMAAAEAAEKAGMDPRGSLEGAANTLENITSTVGKGNRDLMLRKARALFRAGEYEYKNEMDGRTKLVRAANAYSEIIKLEPNNVEAIFERGLAMFRDAWVESRLGLDPQAALTAAIVDLENATRLDPKNPRTAFICADAILFLGQIEENRTHNADDTFRRAEARFQDAIKLDEKNGEVWNGRGNAWWLMADALQFDGSDMNPALDQAETYYRKAIELGFPKAHLNLGMVLAAQRKWDDAEKEFQEAVDKGGNEKQFKDKLQRTQGWYQAYKKKKSAG